MAGLSDIFSLMNNFEAIQALIERIFFLVVCLFLGGFSWKGWKRYQNWGIGFVASLIIGFGVLACSILLAQVLPLRLPFVPYAIQALIVSVIFYVILRLLSGDAQQISKLVKGSTFKQLKKEFEDLKEQFKRVVKLLETKKIMPEPLTVKKLEESLAELLEERGIKEFKITSKRTLDDTKLFNVKAKSNTYEAILNLYTGELIGFNQTNLSFFQNLHKSFKRLIQNRKVFAGFILLAITSAIFLLLLNPESAQDIQQSFDISLNPNITQGSQAQNLFSDYMINNTDCLGVVDALYLISTSPYDEGTSISYELSNYFSNNYPEYEVDSALMATYEGMPYLLVTARSIPNEEFGQAMQDYIQQNMFKVVSGDLDFCEITYNYQSISNYFLICSFKNGDSTPCECSLLSEVEDYCFVFSDMLRAQINEQIGDVTNQLGDVGEQLGGLEGLLGIMQ